MYFKYVLRNTVRTNSHNHLIISTFVISLYLLCHYSYFTLGLVIEMKVFDRNPHFIDSSTKMYYHTVAMAKMFDISCDTI